MAKGQQMQALSIDLRVKAIDDEDFICRTDIAKSKNPDHPDGLIRWLRNRNTLELFGIWKKLHNPGFNTVEFDGVAQHAGPNSFSLTPKQWARATNAIGIQSTAGRYGGTYAHKDFTQPERVALLNATAIEQMRLLTRDTGIQKLNVSDA